MIRVLLADDHAVVRRAFRSILSTDRACEVCAEAADGAEALALAATSRPDVVILDLVMPKLSGIEAARRIRALLPDCEIAIVTMHEGDEIERAAVAAGARTFLHKSDADAHLLPAVRALAAHRPYTVVRDDPDVLRANV
jgi:DNA-binding NarL/FixJ family response regulator